MTTCWQVKINSDDIFSVAVVAAGLPVDLSGVTTVEIVNKNSLLTVSSDSDPCLFMWPTGTDKNVVCCRFGMSDKISSNDSGLWCLYLYKPNGKIFAGNIIININ